MTDTYLCAKLTEIEALIDAYMAAELALAGENGVKEYRINTGQTNEQVTYSDLSMIRRQIDSLLNQRAVLRVRCGIDQGSVVARPGW